MFPSPVCTQVTWVTWLSLLLGMADVSLHFQVVLEDPGIILLSWGVMLRFGVILGGPPPSGVWLPSTGPPMSLSSPLAPAFLPFHPGEASRLPHRRPACGLRGSLGKGEKETDGLHQNIFLECLL